MTEESRIIALEKIFAAADPRGSAAKHAIEVGIGDDAAVLDVAAAFGASAPGKMIVSVDEQVEGTHFRREWLSAEDIGYRATMAAASDLAAMGAAPICAVASLVLPDAIDDATLMAIANGQAEAARALRCPIVGGNLARGPALSLSTTVIGSAVKPLLRKGARPGDGIYVAGPLGLAGLGFASLARAGAPVADPDVADARSAWRRPRARILDGSRAATIAHAGIDVSDGLAKDLRALCTESVAATLSESSLVGLARDTGVAATAAVLGVDWLKAMLGGGEDYAVLIASPAPVDGFVRIGEMHARATGAPAVVLQRANGGTEEVHGGFDHFASAGRF